MIDDAEQSFLQAGFIKTDTWACFFFSPPKQNIEKAFPNKWVTAGSLRLLKNWVGFRLLMENIKSIFL